MLCRDERVRLRRRYPLITAVGAGGSEAPIADSSTDLHLAASWCNEGSTSRAGGRLVPWQSHYIIQSCRVGVDQHAYCALSEVGAAAVKVHSSV